MVTPTDRHADPAMPQPGLTDDRTDEEDMGGVSRRMGFLFLFLFALIGTAGLVAVLLWPK